MAAASETTGAWETVTVIPPSRCSHLAHRLLSFDRERSEERSDSSRTARSSEGDRVTASGHGDFPDEQGIANAPSLTGSDPKNVTGHGESDPDESGSGPKTATDLAETPSESKHNATDSGQKTAIGHTATARGRTATETSPGDDVLDRERKEEPERERQDWSREPPGRERAPQSFPVPRSEDRETREDRERERTAEASPDSPHRRACSDEQGKVTEEAARTGGVHCEQAVPPSSAPEGAEETGARSHAPDERPDTLPSLSLDLGRAGGEEASRDAAPGASRDPPQPL